MACFTVLARAGCSVLRLERWARYEGAVLGVALIALGLLVVAAPALRSGAWRTITTHHDHDASRPGPRRSWPRITASAATIRPGRHRRLALRRRPDRQPGLRRHRVRGRPVQRLHRPDGRRGPQPVRRAGPGHGRRRGLAGAARGRPAQTYGYGKATVLAALANALLLIFACGAIAFEAVRRLAEPAPVASGLIMVVAAHRLRHQPGHRPAVHARPAHRPERARAPICT